MNNNHPIGKFGEGIAERYLEGRKFAIIEKNAHMRVGEIDIVAKDGPLTVFVEVKTRLSQRQGGAVHSFSRAKFGRFQKAAQMYCRHKHMTGPFRLDFIAVQVDPRKKKARIRHFKNISAASFGLG